MRHRDETPFLIARHNLTHYNLFQQETPIEPLKPGHFQADRLKGSNVLRPWRG